MNKTELLAAIDRVLGEYVVSDRDYDEGIVDGFNIARGLAEQLDEPAAMAWQSDYRKGFAYVAGCGRRIFEIDQNYAEVWCCHSDDANEPWYPLDDLRVCYIPDPPPLPEQERAKQ